MVDNRLSTHLTLHGSIRVVSEMKARSEAGPIPLNRMKVSMITQRDQFRRPRSRVSVLTRVTRHPTTRNVSLDGDVERWPREVKNTAVSRTLVFVSSGGIGTQPLGETEFEYKFEYLTTLLNIMNIVVSIFMLASWSSFRNHCWWDSQTAHLLEVSQSRRFQ